MNKPIKFIFATGLNGEFGNKGKLPWEGITSDLKHFNKVTTEVSCSPSEEDSSEVKLRPLVTNAVIMGRKTWKSIPLKSRPLSNRINFVVTSRNALKSGNPDKFCYITKTVREAIRSAQSITEIETIFIIGGVEIFKECVESFQESCSEMIHTTFHGKFEADTILPFESFQSLFSEIVKIDRGVDPVSGMEYTTRTWRNIYHLEIPKLPECLLSQGTSNPGMSFLSSTDIKKNKKSNQFATDAAIQEIIGRELLAWDLISANREEDQYIELLRKILLLGSSRVDRTLVGTRACFGEKMTFSLRGGSFPLLTTKRVPFGCVAKELLWFISGSTDSKELAKTGVRIWDANGSREFLDSRGLKDREVGDLGPIYSFQWRYFGAKYVDCHTDYKGQGIDQLAECIRKIKEDPSDRRIIMSAWNPADLHLMALPPCHMFCQFFVANGELSCMMYQRSADMGLGVPFNIASYALLTILIAHICELLPGDFHHVLGDTHVYNTHITGLSEQIMRKPRAFPKLYLKRKVSSIDDFKFEDFELDGYNPYPTISLPMAL